MNGCDIITYILQTERKLSLEKMRFESRTPALAYLCIASLAWTHDLLCAFSPNGFEKGVHGHKYGTSVKGD